MVVGLSFIHYSHFNLQTDYSHYAWARALQGLGYAFFFVPLSVIAYSQLSPAQNNKASSLTNFFRNWGGSFGIALVTTVSERRQNFHQARVSNNLTASSPGLQDTIKQSAAYLQAHGFSHADALTAAYSRVYQQLHDQTLLLAFMDCFFHHRRHDADRRSAGAVYEELQGRRQSTRRTLGRIYTATRLRCKVKLT